MSLQCSDSDLISIVQNIVETVLHASVLVDEPVNDSRFALSGCIQLAGAWQGAVILDCSDEFAQHAAAAMFSLDDADVQTQDKIDTVAELVNMLGGNIKSILPGPSFLALPTVTAGDDYKIQVPSAHCESLIELNSTIGALRFSIWRIHSSSSDA